MGPKNRVFGETRIPTGRGTFEGGRLGSCRVVNILTVTHKAAECGDAVLLALDSLLAHITSTVATDGVAWSVCVGHSSFMTVIPVITAKTDEPRVNRSGVWTHVGQGAMYQMRHGSHNGMKRFWGIMYPIPPGQFDASSLRREAVARSGGVTPRRCGQLVSLSASRSFPPLPLSFASFCPI